MSSISNNLGLLHDDDAEGGNSLSAHKQTLKGDTTWRNLILIKESEIAALKEVIEKWRNRAIEAHIMHSRAKTHFDEQLVKLHMQHQSEINAIKNTCYKNEFEEDDDDDSTKNTSTWTMKEKQSNSRETNNNTSPQKQDIEIYSSETAFGQAKVLERLMKSFPKFIRKTTKKPKCSSINSIELNLKTLGHKHKCYNISQSDLKQSSLFLYKSDDSISKSSSSDTITVEEKNPKDNVL